MMILTKAERRMSRVSVCRIRVGRRSESAADPSQPPTRVSRRSESAADPSQSPAERRMTRFSDCRIRVTRVSRRPERDGPSLQA